jgi:hypothetical protein
VNALSKLLSTAAVVSFVLLVGQGSAFALLNESAQKCIDTYNNSLAKVSKAQNKQNRTCVKNAGKGKESDPEGCLTRAVNGKVTKAKVKVDDAVSRFCVVGDEPIIQPGQVGNDAHQQAALDLIHDIFGSDLNVGGVINPGKGAARCQDRTLLRASQLMDEKLKVFGRCKKGGINTGAIDDAASLEAACMTPTIPSPKNRIARKIARLKDDIEKNCPVLASLFLGVCAAETSPAGLADCIDKWVECRVCAALNAADGMMRDCDAFDDGVVNGSCGGTEPTCGDGTVNQVSEDCDPPDDSACPGQCQMNCTCPADPFCGDGIVNQSTEDCDRSDDAACPGECQPGCTCPLGGQCPADGTDTGCWQFDRGPLCHFCCIAGTDACSPCRAAFEHLCLDPYSNALCDEELNGAGCGEICCP